MNPVGCVPRLLKAHGSLVLTILSGLGLIGTAVTVAKEAPKAKEQLEKELRWKIHFRVDEMMDEMERNGHGSEPEDWTDDEHAELYDIAERETRLTVMDKIKVAGPIYAPGVILALLTIGCIGWTQYLNTKQKAAVLAAYGMLSAEYNAYRDAIRQNEGEEADAYAYTEAQRKIKELKAEVQALKEENGPFLWTLAWLPGVIFEEKPSDIEESFRHFNRNLLLRGYGDLKELHDFFGLPAACYSKDDAEMYGWNEYENDVAFEIPTVDFRTEKVRAMNGRVIRMITTQIPPYDFNHNCDDPGWSDACYGRYDPDAARAFAEHFDPSRVIKVDHPEISHNSLWGG